MDLSYFLTSMMAAAVLIPIAVILLIAIILAKVLLPLRNPHLKTPIRGTLTITAASALDPRASASNMRLTGVIQAEGIMPTPVDRRLIASSSKWPTVGRVYPVMTDASDPTKFRILWDEVPTGNELGVSAAVALAQQLSGHSTTATTQTHVTINGRSVDVSAAQDLSQAISQAVGGNAAPLINALAESGQPATAIVLDVVENPNGHLIQTQMSVEVQPEDGSPVFNATLNTNFMVTSPRRERFCQAGARVPVRYQPHDKSSVQLDLGRLDS